MEENRPTTKNKTGKHRDGIPVNNPILAYHIIDKGLLHHLRGATQKPNANGYRTYWFEEAPEVREVIEDFDPAKWGSDPSRYNFSLW